MSQEEKNNALPVDGTVEGSATVTEVKKEGLLKRLWSKSIVRKITKGIAAGAACLASGIVGYKLGTSKIEWQPLPEAEDEPESEGDDAE